MLNKVKTKESLNTVYGVTLMTSLFLIPGNSEVQAL